MLHKNTFLHNIYFRGHSISLNEHQPKANKLLNRFNEHITIVCQVIEHILYKSHE